MRSERIVLPDAEEVKREYAQVRARIMLRLEKAQNPNLSDYQRDTLILAFSGRTNVEIAQELQTTVSGVKSALLRAMRIVGVKNRKGDPI